MVKRNERDAIEELAQLLDGELSPDEAEAPVRRLATLVATINETEVVERPSPATRAALRNQLIADIQAGEVTAVDRVRDAVWHRTARVRNSARIAVASAVSAGMLGSAGVAAAAQHALPGDALYGIKRATESVRMALASGLREEAYVHIALAEERLEELRDGAGELTVDETVDTLARMDASSLAASDAIIQAVADGADPALLEELARFTERQRAGLVDLYDGLPVAAQPFADASLEVLRRIDIDVAATIGPCGVCEQIAAGSDVGSVTPGDGIDTRHCDCIDPGLPPLPREPGVSVPSSPPSAPLEGSDEGTSGTADGDTDEPDLIPPLPGPLDEVGDAVDDVITDIVDTTNSLDGTDTSVSDVEDLETTVEDTLETTTEDTLDTTTDTLEQPVEDTTSDVGDLLEP